MGVQDKMSITLHIDQLPKGVCVEALGSPRVPSSSARSRLKMMVLLWMAVQSSFHSLLIHYSRVRETPERFFSTVAVFCTEAMKACICVAMVYYESKGFTHCLRKMKQQIVDQPRETLKVWIPALLYIVQNNLFYVAASHLDAAPFMVFSQMKIFSTAIFAILLMGHVLSSMQWVSLLVLFTGVCLIQTHPSNAAHAHSHVGIAVAQEQPDPYLGFVAVSIACIISGFAGVYFEKILKGSKCGEQISIWTRNVQMSIFSVPVSLLTAYIQDGPALQTAGFFYGFDGVVWLTVFFYCVGGISVAMCIKYADNIAKNFATSSAIILSTIGSVYFFDFEPNLYFVGGAALVVLSIFLYSSFSAATHANKSNNNTSDGAKSEGEKEALLPPPLAP